MRNQFQRKLAWIAKRRELLMILSDLFKRDLRRLRQREFLSEMAKIESNIN
jgi:hypothetical protein